MARSRGFTALLLPMRPKASAAEARRKILSPLLSIVLISGLMAGLPILARARMAARFALSPPPLPDASISGVMALGSPSLPSSSAAILLFSLSLLDRFLSITRRELCIAPGPQREGWRGHGFDSFSLYLAACLPR